MALQQRIGVRVFNRLGQSWRQLSRQSSPFDADQIERRARERVGWGDFGHAQYREPLEKLCDSYAADRGLTFTGQLICRGTLGHHLENRLRIQDALAQTPEITQRPIARPLFVIGLPRTGTTLLYNLLAKDSTSRSLLFWESMQPAPPPTPETRDSDPRIAKARRTVRGLHFGLPELADIHEFHADGPEECLGLLMNSFMTPFFRGRIPAYREWLEGVSEEFVTQAYEEFRTQLQILQWRIAGRRWLLKCPSHLAGLSGLLRVFPDACIVQTHRHLSQSLPSLCSLTATVDQLCYAHIDRDEVGRRGLRTVGHLLKRGLLAREQAPSESIVDIPYEALIHDPVAAVERIYQHFGMTVTPEFESSMRSYLEQDRHARRKPHSYSLEQFGLSSDILRERFHDYHDRFDLRAGESTTQPA